MAVVLAGGVGLPDRWVVGHAADCRRDRLGADRAGDLLVGGRVAPARQGQPVAAHVAQAHLVMSVADLAVADSLDQLVAHCQWVAAAVEGTYPEVRVARF